MAVTATSTPSRRPRHDPRDTEREILVAAEALLRERPFREVTVERIMLRTGLKRPAFYAHFHDRYELVPRVLQSIELRLFEATNRWLEGEGHERDLSASAAAAVAVYAEQGPILRALADGAASDAKLEETYSGLVQTFIDANAEKIRAEQANGHIATDLDAEETARALVLLTERYLGELFGREPQGDPARAAAVLHRIWVSTLYGGEAPAPAPADTGSPGA